MGKSAYLLFVLFFLNLAVFAQEDLVDLSITLKNNKGGFYTSQLVKLISKNTGKSYNSSTDADGVATFKLPVNDVYTVSISNYSRKREIIVPNVPGGRMTNVFNYAPNMVEMHRKFEMSETEKTTLNNFVNTLPDTLLVKSSRQVAPSINEKFYATVNLHLKNIKDDPLTGEVTTFTGIRSGKSIKSSTDSKGNLLVYLPKGDTYTINFKYNKTYAKYTIDYSKASPRIKLSYSYLGTKEIEKRKKEEEQRIAALEKELKEEEARFKAECDRLGLTLEECRKREIESFMSSEDSSDDSKVISEVLNRNKWTNKLVVCDLTGSMSPYTAELSVWYALNMSREKDIQFTFFNDGDEMDDDMKKIGETGGIYYTSYLDSQSLLELCSEVSAAGSGGDAQENDMEALLMATSAATPFKELILIADSDSPVRDIELLQDFKYPIHIILCGFDGTVYEDYLNMALKTKGSIHTIEEDITKIAAMSEGQTLKIADRNYKIMGGSFVLID